MLAGDYLTHARVETRLAFDFSHARRTETQVGVNGARALAVEFAAQIERREFGDLAAIHQGVGQAWSQNAR